MVVIAGKVLVVGAAVSSLLVVDAVGATPSALLRLFSLPLYWLLPAFFFFRLLGILILCRCFSDSKNRLCVATQQQQHDDINNAGGHRPVFESRQ